MGGGRARYALLEAGETEQAYQTLVGSCGGEELPRIPGSWRAMWLDVMTRCLLLHGRLDEARRVAEVAQRISGRYGLPLATAAAELERAMAELEAANQEIAAEQFLSIKTVETHMRNIFRKLDAGSRVEVARIAEAR